jgi:hypothetical protein
VQLPRCLSVREPCQRLGGAISLHAGRSGVRTALLKRAAHSFRQLGDFLLHPVAYRFELFRWKLGVSLPMRGCSLNERPASVYDWLG